MIFMARQGSGKGLDEDDLSRWEREFEEQFGGLRDTPAKDCGIEEIDPSKPGWEIFLHFQGVDPRVPDTQAYEDLKTLRHFAKMGIAKCEYKEGTKTVVLSYLADCGEEEFPEEYLELMRKYSPTAKAPQEARRGGAQPTLKATRDSASEIMAKANAMVLKPPIIRLMEDEESCTPPIIQNAPIGGQPQTNSGQPDQNLNVPDDVTFELPLDEKELAPILERCGCKSLEELIEKLKVLVGTEDLLLEHGELDGVYMINIYKDPKIKYTSPMYPEDVEFLNLLK